MSWYWRKSLLNLYTVDDAKANNVGKVFLLKDAARGIVETAHASKF